jgi:hypothetical protein
MPQIWDESRILQYIQNEVQENLQLEYKGAGALATSDDKKKEIAKDVSSMANSVGGVLIYGIAEYQSEDKKHLPEKIDPIDISIFSKERLEQIIHSGIQPKIDGLIIHAIQLSLSPNYGVYVIEIPQSNTAHQVVKEHRYYKRYNFLATPMEDYEIRDVMGRGQYPKIELEFEILRHISYRSSTDLSPSETIRRTWGATLIPRELKQEEIIYHRLEIYAVNNGKSLAKYIEAMIEIPDSVLPEQSDEKFTFTIKRRTYDRNGILCYKHRAENFYDAQYIPILPTRSLRLKDGISLNRFTDEFIYWEVFADNSPPQRGQISLAEIPIEDDDTFG